MWAFVLQGNTCYLFSSTVESISVSLEARRKKFKSFNTFCRITQNLRSLPHSFPLFAHRRISLVESHFLYECQETLRKILCIKHTHTSCFLCTKVKHVLPFSGFFLAKKSKSRRSITFPFFPKTCPSFYILFDVSPKFMDFFLFPTPTSHPPST